MPTDTHTPRVYLPNIFDLKRLFTNPLQCDSSTKVGFDHGSTVLIAGAPGLGRTVISLSLVRDLLCQYDDSKLYYVTTEMNHEALERRYRNYGWFVKGDAYFSTKERCRIVHVAEDELPQPTRGAGVLISKVVNEIRSDRHQILRSRQTSTASSRAATEVDSHEKLPAFVIVDSVTALLKDSQTFGDRRRNVQELIVGLKKAIGDEDLALVFLTSEEVAAQIPAEIHLADVVFEVGFEDTGSGSRLRTLEVTKCHGRYLPLGQHTWATINQQNAIGVIASEDLLDHVKEIATRSATIVKGTPTWGTLVVFPRPRFPAIGEMNRNGDSDAGLIRQQMVSTGIPGLDAMIRGASEYWSQSAGQALQQFPTASLFPGSTTIFIGCSGTGKTTALLQILHSVEPQEARIARRRTLWRSVDPEWRKNDDAWRTTCKQITDHDTLCKLDPRGDRTAEEQYSDHSLYVTFENRPSRVRHWFPQDNDWKKALAGVHRACHMLYRRRANLDFNALLAEIEFIIKRHQIRRVAIDGLSDLLSTHSPAVFARMTEALLLTIRATGAKREPVSIFIGLESDVSSLNSAALQAISFAADNVVALRNISLNDEHRKTIQVIKARGHSPDPQIREIIVTGNSRYPLRVVPGLEDYSGLHSAEPEPVRVAIQLLAENPAENRCNQLLLDRLCRQFGHPIDAFQFSRPEIQATLADMAAGSMRIPFADVKILSIDEWLIRDLRIEAADACRRQTLADAPLGSAAVTPPLLQLDRSPVVNQHRESRLSHSDTYRPPSDFWFFETEKATQLIFHPPAVKDTHGIPSSDRKGREAKQEQAGTIEPQLVALPNYLDYGMFCINPRLAQNFSKLPSKLNWPDCVSLLPRQWGLATADGWFYRPRSGGPTLVDWMRSFLHAPPTSPEPHGNTTDEQERDRDRPQREQLYGFSFDMETPVSTACAFLEFCWAFGAPEDFLVRGIEQQADNRSRDAATQALLFLQFLVLEELMPARAKHADSARSLFSRHWYSSLQDVMVADDSPVIDDEGSDVAACGAALIPLPYLPVGAYRRIDDPDPRRWRCPEAVQHAVYDILMRMRRHVSRVCASIRYRTESPTSRNSVEADTLRRKLASVANSLSKRAQKYSDGSPGWENINEMITDVKRQCQYCETQLDAIIAFSTTPEAQQIFPVGKGFSAPPQSSFSRVIYPYPDTDTAKNREFQYLAAAQWMDIRDILAVCDWARFRVRMIREECRALLLAHRSLTGPQTEAKGYPVVTALTGYSCEGSWLLGVDSRTHSPNLAKRIIDEIASEHTTDDRGALGAGIPSRKDFYDHHGAEPVPNIGRDDLTWADFLKQIASAACRRERTVCSHVRKSLLFDHLDHLVQHALLVAFKLQTKYRDDRGTVVKQVQDLTARLITGLFDFVESEMRRAVPNPPDDSPGNRAKETFEIPCLTCATPQICRKALRAQSRALRHRSEHEM